MKVYRIEDVKGYGAFSVEAADMHDLYARRGCKRRAYGMPCPRDSREAGTELAEKIDSLGYGDWWVFGFTSKTQLLRAFGSKRGRRKMQEETKVFVSIYEVGDSHVIKGNHQVVFDRSLAHLVERLDCETLESLNINLAA